MSCYQSLVSNRFICNAPSELLSAKRYLKASVAMTHNGTAHSFIREQNKVAYYTIGNTLGFFEEMYRIDTELGKLYYLTYENYLMVLSRNRTLIDTAVSSAHNVNGDIPLYRHKHTVNKKVIHTVLFNTDFTIPPASLN
tara:strand:+ start:198 stop:614 length:417 start_codon:yes stop_codon:yes gene_type:complete